MAITRSHTRKAVEEKAATRNANRRRKPASNGALAVRRRRSLPSTHGMRTRSKARVFRFLDLPPEVRNMTYRFAFAGSPTALSKLRLPRSLQAPQILREARPFVFESTPFTVVTRSNMCVRYRHLHTAKHVRFESTGKIDWPPAVKNQPAGLVRFRSITLEGLCCCCREGMAIARIRVDVVPGSDETAAGKLKAMVSKQVVNRAGTYDEVIQVLDRMLSTAEECMEKIDARMDFNGLTIQDVEDLALCFRDMSDDSGEHESDEE